MDLRLVVSGVVLLGFGSLGVWDVMAKASWVTAKATVVAIDTSCDMQAYERGILSKTTSTATIDCADADAFAAYHADKEWTKIERFDGKLRVSREGQTAVVAMMPLRRVDGRAPQVGDVLTVSQDPAHPEKIRATNAGSYTSMLTLGCAVLGVVVLAFGILRRPKPRLTQAQVMAAMQAIAAAAPMPAEGPSQRTAYAGRNVPQPAPARRGFGRRT